MPQILAGPVAPVQPDRHPPRAPGPPAVPPGPPGPHRHRHAADGRRRARLPAAPPPPPGPAPPPPPPPLIGSPPLLAAAVVHGSGPPCPYRLGQHPSRELRVNVPEFQRKNLIKTNTARQAEADKVPPFMINDPAPIKELQQSLEDLVDAIAKAPGPADLPEGLAEAWKLDASTFDDLKLA